MNKKKKIVAARKVKEKCTEHCRLQCSKNELLNMKRKGLHEYFWKLGDLYKQRAFLVQHTKEKVRSHHSRGKRNANLGYYINIGDKQIEVCKKYFLNTFGISDRYVYTARRKTDSHDILEADLRGKAKNRAISEALLDDVRAHIKSFPTIESHYLRVQTKRQYLKSSLSLAEIYRLYVEKCVKLKRNRMSKNTSTERYSTLSLILAFLSLENISVPTVTNTRTLHKLKK